MCFVDLLENLLHRSRPDKWRWVFVAVIDVLRDRVDQLIDAGDREPADPFAVLSRAELAVDQRRDPPIGL